MVYGEVIGWFILISAGAVMILAILMSETDDDLRVFMTLPALAVFGFAGIFLGTSGLTETINKDQQSRKASRIINKYCHPSRPERIIIQKSRNSVTMPYKVKVTVLPDGGCTKVKKEIKP